MEFFRFSSIKFLWLTPELDQSILNLDVLYFPLYEKNQTPNRICFRLIMRPHRTAQQAGQAEHRGQVGQFGQVGQAAQILL